MSADTTKTSSAEQKPKKTKIHLHDQDLKAKVMAFILVGKKSLEIQNLLKAEGTTLAISTIDNWRKESGSSVKKVLDIKGTRDFGEMMATYLTEAITTATEIAKFSRNTGWLYKQNARDVAGLSMITIDKIMQLLAAMEKAGLEFRNLPEPTAQFPTDEDFALVDAEATPEDIANLEADLREEYSVTELDD